MAHAKDSFVADIGGTNLRIARCRPGGGATLPIPETLECADYDSILAALTDGLHRLELVPDRGAVAIAAPVVQDRVKMTNGPWTFSIDQLTQDLGLEELRVVNDLAALAQALPHLDPVDLEQIGSSTTAKSDTRAVIAPGTGLGVAGLLTPPTGTIALSGEGGHVDFAPANEREIELWRWFADRYDHVSAERILSGPGLADLYGAVAGIDGATPAINPAKANAVKIAELAQAKRCPVALTAVRDFSAILGAVAGDLALTLGARGGIYLAGGVLIGLANAFDRAAFRQRFDNKGRFRTYLQSIPCYLIHTTHPTLIGLAQMLKS
ncbi:MAG: glucokinase [Proteobacteria bacterium]|nr:glucokinase [Pseudomonadota bacterium]